MEELFKNKTPNASDLIKYAEKRGWNMSQSKNGPIKFKDKNGIERLIIKKGSPRTIGSEMPHVEIKNSQGKRIDPYGVSVSKKSPKNHTPINWDL